MQTLRKRILLSEGNLNVILLGRRGVQGPKKDTLVIDFKGAPLVEISSLDYNMPHNRTEKFLLELCNKAGADIIEQLGFYQFFKSTWCRFKSDLAKKVKTQEYKDLWYDYNDALVRAYERRKPLIEVKQKRVLCTLVKTKDQAKMVSFTIHRGDNRSHFFNFQIAIEVRGRVIHSSYQRESAISDVDVLEKVAIATLDSYCAKHDIPEHKAREYEIRTRSGVTKLRKELEELLFILNNNYDW